MSGHLEWTTGSRNRKSHRRPEVQSGSGPVGWIVNFRCSWACASPGSRVDYLLPSRCGTGF